MDFWDIYDGHYARVHRYVNSMLRDRSASEDVVQETFIRVHRDLGTVREPEKISSWVFRVAHNLCIDHLRARLSSAVEPGAEADAVGAGSADEELDRGWMSACMREKIELLPENHRSMVLLCDIMEMSQQEAAEILGIEAGAVKVRLHRARSKLRSILNDNCSFTRDERNVLVCEPAGQKKE